MAYMDGKAWSTATRAKLFSTIVLLLSCLELSFTAVAQGPVQQAPPPETSVGGNANIASKTPNNVRYISQFTTTDSGAGANLAIANCAISGFTACTYIWDTSAP